MRTVFSNNYDCMHTFALQNQQHGRSSNVFFYGNKIYSYGYHYLLAEIIDNYCIINDSGYSVTTSKHISDIIAALRQYKQYFETQIDGQKVLRHIKYYLYEKLKKARKPEKYINEAQYLYGKYCTFYAETNRPLPIENAEICEYMELINSFMIPEVWGQKVSELQAKKDAKEKKEKREKLRKAKKDIQKFLNFESDTIYNSIGEDFIRYNPETNNVETSQNVKIPLKNAQTLYKLIKAKKDIKGLQIENVHGQKFTVISINGTLKIGCHNINKKNMVNVGEQIINL